MLLVNHGAIKCLTKAHAPVEQLLTSANIQISMNPTCGILKFMMHIFMLLDLKNPFCVWTKVIWIVGDCEHLDQFFYYLLRAAIEEKIKHSTNFLFYLLCIKLFSCLRMIY